VPDVAAKPAAGRQGSGETREQRLTELGEAFHHAYRVLRSRRGRDTHLCSGQLSYAQFELLAELLRQGPLPMGELAGAAGLSPATVSQMLDHLVDEGQVERARSESDRRVVVIKLTRNGRRRIESRKAMWRERWERGLEGVSAEELRIACDVLARIGGVFEESAE
jgi:DNA-binding MarR family transcriptional regulator